MRHVLGWLEDHRVSAEQRRKHLPRRDGHGEVERRHQATYADGTPEAHRPLRLQLTRHGVAKEAASFSGGVVRRVDAFLYVPARLLEWLPHLAGHQVRDLLLTIGHEIAYPSQHVATCGRRCATPDLEPTLGGYHRVVDVDRRRE